LISSSNGRAIFSRLALLISQWILYGLLSANLERAYGYTKIGFEGPSAVAVVLSIGALGLVAVALPSKVTLPSQAALWLLATFIVVPTLSVAASNPNFETGTSMTAALVVMIGFLVTTSITKVSGKPKAQVFQLRTAVTRRGYMLLIAAIATIAIVTVFLAIGPRALDLSFSSETERRLAARLATAPFPGAFYLTTWLKTVLVPLLVVLGLEWKKYALIVFAILGAVSVFLFSGEKAAFVYPFIAVLLFGSLRLSRKRPSRPWFGILLTGGVIAIPMVLSLIIPKSGIDIYVTRRFGLVPAQLTHTYVEYTDSFGFTFFRQSFLRFLGGDTRTMGVRVGQWLDSTGELNANAHAWADGFGSGGWAGLLLIAIFLGLLLTFLDSLSLSRDAIVSTAVLGTVCFAFVNGYFHTSLLTDGVIFSVLLVTGIPSRPVTGVQPLAAAHTRTQPNELHSSIDNRTSA
jgi:hypothetical protein